MLKNGPVRNVPNIGMNKKDIFKILFGVSPKAVKESCLVMPLLPKKALEYFSARSYIRGKLYGTAQAKNFTLIHAGMHPALVMDVVLYLKESSCKNILLFGSCGLAKERQGFSLGSLVSPFQCLAADSASAILTQPVESLRSYYPEEKFFRSLLKAGEPYKLKSTTCLTTASLKLEEERLERWVNRGVEVFDMELAGFFSAASFSGLNACALFYISDIVKNKPFYLKHDPVLGGKLNQALIDACSLIKEFLK